MHPTASASLRIAFALYSLVIASLLVVAFANAGPKNKRQIGLFALSISGWLALSAVVGLSGALTHWEKLPPPLVPLALLSMGSAVALSRSRFGARMAHGLPMSVLVGLQAFRFPLELLMHKAAAEGTMPVQMTFGAPGCNDDFLTGLSAMVVALLASNGKASQQLLRMWNDAGLLLLAAIVSVAVLSTPTFAAFGPDRLNTWVAYFPFVWLIAFFVPLALLGHLLLLRRLQSKQRPLV